MGGADLESELEFIEVSGPENTAGALTSHHTISLETFFFDYDADFGSHRFRPNSEGLINPISRTLACERASQKRESARGDEAEQRNVREI